MSQTKANTFTFSSPPKDDGDTSKSTNTDEVTPKQLPKGVVLGKDGKPCRSCTSFAAWAAMTKKETSSSSSSSTNSSTSSSTTTTSQPSSSTSAITLPFPSQQGPPPDCPPDVNQLGSSTWTLLHSITAAYPERADRSTQATARQFLSSFAQMYPCWHCATDFQAWMGEARNAPRVSSRAEFGEWMCEAHNAVNRKLGKREFDCGRWEERWRVGWSDGRCD